MTQIIFITICLFTLLLFYCSDIYNSKLLLIISVLVLSLSAGLRDSGVGIDTEGYIFNFIADFPYAWKFSEEGFRWISRLLMRLFNNNTTWLLFIYALITNYLIVIRLWDFRKKASFSFMMFIYLMLHYINTMNIMRQYIAIAIIFFATKYLERKRYFIFTLLLIISSTIHTSALLGVAFLFVYIWNNASVKIRKYLIIPMVISIPLICIYLFKAEAGNITNYLSTTIDNVNIVFIYRAFVFVFALSLQYARREIVFSSRRNCYEQISKPDDRDNRLVSIKITDYEVIFSIFGLIALSFGMFFTYMSRLGLYYSVYEMVFWGMIVKNGKSNKVLQSLIMIYAIYMFGSELFTNGSGIFPYTLHWF